MHKTGNGVGGCVGVPKALQQSGPEGLLTLSAALPQGDAMAVTGGDPWRVRMVVIPLTNV